MAVTLGGITIEVVKKYEFTIGADVEFSKLDSGDITAMDKGKEVFVLVLQILLKPYGEYTTRDAVVKALADVVYNARVNKAKVSLAGLNTMLNGDYYASFEVTGEFPGYAEGTLTLRRENF